MQNLQSKIVTIYSDGACSGNPGPGGIGVIMMYQNNFKEISGYIEHTTNNQMELLALIVALDSLKQSCEVEVFLDSKYVADGITKWINNWKRNNWKSSSKKEVKNIKLWQYLDNITKNHKINYNWLKGHSDNVYNNQADRLAVDAIKNKLPVLAKYSDLFN